MAAVTKDDLRQQIKVVLKDVELSSTSAKKVRQQLEEHYGESLLNRKEEINELVKEYVNSREDSSDDYQSDEDGTDEDEENNKKKPVKRPAPPANAKKNAKKSKGDSSSEEESDQEEESNESDDDSYPAKKPIPKKKAPPKKKGKGSDSDSDSDWGKGKGKKGGSGGGGGGAAGAGAGAGRGKGGGGYTRAYKLSPQLASLMGKESMARHEVVKKMWALIKERNLYDPNNKQFAICDEDLMKVIGTKRFRTFGMMKYLKSHFRD